MASVQLDGISLTAVAGESVLDTLLRNGVGTPYSCKSGVCGSCLMRASAGNPPEASQVGLKDSWKLQGYFLPCVCRPESDLTIARPGEDAHIAAAITSLVPLSSSVLRVRLRPSQPLEFRSGQYITLIQSDSLARSYSLAGLPGLGELELHVRLHPHGRMSNWLRQEARPGSAVRISGPSGSCFYAPGRPEQPLLLVGTGTGLAPLYGILQDALIKGHRGPIHLFHGAKNFQSLYLVAELRKLASQHKNVQYTPVVLDDLDPVHFAIGPMDRVVFSHYSRLTGHRAFLCGDPAIVRKLKKDFFLAGVSSRDLHCDAFLPSAAL